MLKSSVHLYMCIEPAVRKYTCTDESDIGKERRPMGRYYDVPEYDAAFERYVGLMADLMIKYGPRILAKHLEQQQHTIWYPDILVKPSPEVRLHRLERFSESMKNMSRRAA